MDKKIIVPVSYFNKSSESKLVEINIKTNEKREIYSYVSSASLAVKGKGFTQIVYDKKDNLFVIADYNQFHIFDVKLNRIIKTISSNIMNDIHAVKLHNDLIILTNTGFDSIEIYNKQYDFIQSINLLSFEKLMKRYSGNESIIGEDNYYDNDCNKPFNQRKIKDTFHLNNCTVINNRLIATSFTKKTLLDLSQNRDISPALDFHIHDCFSYDDKLWITSVNGKILYRNNDIDKFSEFIEFVDLFNIGDYYGWCRGLNFYDGCFYIGITQINSVVLNSRWDANVPIEDTKTGIIKLDIKSKSIVDFYDLTDKNISRIFGFIIK